MKKALSILLTLCMTLSLFSGLIAVTEAAAAYETVTLNGFTAWTQAELDTSSGNNGYANSCSTSLSVTTAPQYIVGGGSQAIKAVYGGSTAYNNCIVNWKFGSGGPCTAGNVWAPADGSDVDYAAYDGIRVAVLNAKGEPANFSKITFRVTHGWNYSSNMRFWEGTPVRDDEGYFYFDFASFASNGAPAGADIYDYMKNTAKGISMLCYGGTTEETCYYSAVELYRVKDGVRKNALKDAVAELESYGVVFYADEIAAAKTVINSSDATQEQVDAQLAIIEACIEAYKTSLSTGYTYVQLDGIQNWTEEEAAAMDGFGSTYSVSDQGLVGDAKQSIKLTAKQDHTRFCFATRYANAGPFSTYNPYKVTNEADGKLSDYDGIAIAFSDENGEQIEISKFTARLMRDLNDWNSYWIYEANYVDMSSCYANGYYHLKFADYPALAGAIDDVSILSVLFHRDVKAGDTAYISDIKAYNYEEPEIVEYEFAQLDGIQNWTEEEAAAMNGFGSTYSISDKGLIGAAKQSLKLTAHQNHTRFCFATQNKSGGFSTLNPFKLTNPADGKLSDYDGIAIAFSDENGEQIEISKFTARLMRNSSDWGSYWSYEANYEDMSSCYVNGYYYLSFADYPALAGGIDDLAIMSILFYRNVKTDDTAYISDMKAYRVVKNIDYSKLEQAIETLKANNADGKYDAEIAAAEAALKDDAATQETVDAAVAQLSRILREILLKPVEFDEDNIVLSFGAVSDIHIQGSVTDAATKKYTNALQKLKQFAGGKLDAITIAGDLSNNNYYSSIGTAFKQVTDSEMGENANVFFVSGNHDAQENQWTVLNQFYTDLAKYTTDDLPSSQLDRGNRHKVINGYHYIGVNMMDYWNAAEATFDTRDLEWLAAELEAARADAPGQPIFVYVHAGVYGTTYGSDLYTGTYWGSKAIYSYLENYPEVVTFSGHVHFPLADERTIYQKDFTSLNCGSVQYMAIENGYLQSGSKTTVAESHQVSSGLLVQVDKNNNIKVTRLDFTNGKIIKEPFYVSAPDLEHESNLLHYNDDYFNLDNTAPVFGEEADVFGVQYGDNMEVTFSAAADNDMVHHYIIEIKGLTSGVKESVKAFSEFYLYPTAEDFPEEHTFTIPYTPGQEGEDVEITVWAVDSMGLKSEALVYNPDLVEPPAITAQPTDASAHNGEEASVSLTATGKGLTYKWYYRNKGASTFIRALGYAEPTYAVEMNEDTDGRQVYCVVVDKYGNEVTSDTATLTLLPDPVDPVKITTQPKTTYGKEGATVKVTVKAEGDGLKYAWYIKNSGKTSYSKSSVTSSTYSVKISSSSHGRLIYCVVTDQYGNEAKSNTVIIRRQASITKESATVKYAQYNAKAAVKVTALGDGLKYTWYVKNVGASKYSKSSITKSSYSVTMTDKVKDRRVYCMVTDKYGKTVQSKTFTLRMSASITTQPKTVTVKKNATAKVTLKAKGDSLKYTWYVKNEGAKKYSKSSVTKSTYSVKMTSKVKNRLVYVVVKDKYGNTIKSKTVRLKMK